MNRKSEVAAEIPSALPLMKSRKEILQEFLAEDPGDLFSRYALALELEKEGRDQEAIAQFQEAIGQDPSYLPVYYQLGRILARTGRLEEARDVYKSGAEVAAAARDQKTHREILEALSMID